MTLTAIQSLTMDDVREMITRAMQTGLDGTVIEDFVASVDWSNHDSATPQVQDALGSIEGWAIAYVEGDLTVAEYAANLLAVLSQKEPLTA